MVLVLDARVLAHRSRSRGRTRRDVLDPNLVLSSSIRASLPTPSIDTSLPLLAGIGAVSAVLIIGNKVITPSHARAHARPAACHRGACLARSARVAARTAVLRVVRGVGADAVARGFVLGAVAEALASKTSLERAANLAGAASVLAAAGRGSAVRRVGVGLDATASADDGSAGAARTAHAAVATLKGAAARVARAAVHRVRGEVGAVRPALDTARRARLHAGTGARHAGVARCRHRGAIDLRARRGAGARRRG